MYKKIRIHTKLLIYRFTRQRHHYISDKNFLIIAAIWVGLLAGFAAVVLKSFVHFLQHLLEGGINVRYENYLYLIYPLIGILLSVVYVKLFHKKVVFDKGLSSIIYAINKKFSNIELHKTYSHVITSALTVGFGGSAGLEAPIAVTGSALGSNTAKNLLMSKADRTLLLASGAAAGISAIFDSPITGVVFAFEVLLTEVSIPAFIPLLIASATGAVVSKIFSDGKIFYLVTDSWNIEAIPFYILLGGLCGFVSVYMIRTTLGMESFLNKRKNPYTKAVAGGIALGVLIFIFPPLYGEGYGITNKLMAGDYKSLFNNSLFFKYQDSTLFLLGFTAVMILVKVFAASITVGSGGNGGIFGPSLFTGSLLGFWFAHGVNYTRVTFLNEQNFIAVAMGGLISGVLHAPLTGIFLIAEITGGYILFIPLMIVSAMSYFIVRYFEPNSIYTKTLIERGYIILDKDTALLSELSINSVVENDFSTLNPRQTLRELVATVSASKRNLFPVIDKHNKLVGIITMDDIREVMFKQNLYDKIRVNELMSIPKITVGQAEKMEEVMKYFEEYEVWYIPVIDEDAQYVGFISKTVVLHQYRERLIETSDDV
ncbi:MAG TPA: chloride channel protein [Bacteroidetes bacterium]|nr:chloride channel protein [Bacteroidota bacterium]